MLRPVQKISGPTSHLSRFYHSSSSRSQAYRQLQLPPGRTQPTNVPKYNYEEKSPNEVQNAPPPVTHAKRNEVGVQLLSRSLHSQIFRNTSFPPPEPAYVNIAREHLEQHKLDPSQGSVLPDTAFTLPPLQGNNLLEHFYRIGSHAAQPWLSLAKQFSNVELPPRPTDWDIQAGWTKYYYSVDGSSYSEHVEFPAEDMLTFDVETMPKYHPNAVMACAASETAWYAWISPWLLDQTQDPQQLIPLGNPDVPKVVVGHNVSYDRGRLLEEYSLKPTQTRFLDTMALHVAVKGISSNQRPAWMQYRKLKREAETQREETVEAVVEMIQDVEERHSKEEDAAKREELKRLRQEMEESLPSLQGNDAGDIDATESEVSTKRWEDLTSANSLADVAKLHCNIVMDKEARNDFMTCTPDEIRENITDYLTYCATDVYVTHCVYVQALPAFLTACPHPVSFAGILTMGSSFLTVNEEWERYLANAEGVYRDLEEKIKQKLKELAEQAKAMMVPAGSTEKEKWRDDVWLSQLDWTPKAVGKSRGLEVPEDTVTEVTPTPELVPSPSTQDVPSETATISSMPAWYSHILSDPLGKKSYERILPLLLRLSYDGHPMEFKPKEKWHFHRKLKGGKVIIDRLDTAKEGFNIENVLGKKHALPAITLGKMEASDLDLATELAKWNKDDQIKKRVLDLARKIHEEVDQATAAEDPWLKQLDWKLVSQQRPTEPQRAAVVSLPDWYKHILSDPFSKRSLDRIAPLLLRLSYDGHPLVYSARDQWHYLIEQENRTPVIRQLDTAQGKKTAKLLGKKHCVAAIKEERMASTNVDLAIALSTGIVDRKTKKLLLDLAKKVYQEARTNPDAIVNDPWLKQLNWDTVVSESAAATTVLPATKPRKVPKPKVVKPTPIYWPKWYWEATKPKKDLPRGTLDITVRNRISPLLLRLSWLGWPLFHSREHGWMFRVDASAKFTTRLKALHFYDPADDIHAKASSTDGGYIFYKLPHKDGDQANVGSPLAKTFMKYAMDGTLKSPGDEAKEALDMNAQCSYWISARDRIMNQNVVWQQGDKNLGFEEPQQVEGESKKKWGIILPQVITMGTVTRRAIEKTWLTASNAKKNRVGSELKAMVRAPPGYSIVGADVDSEELWISSCMGDAQFGLHGATAIGWMTLEGTKAAGTDLHSKTASILGISRDQAKVFNYSRIYGAGMRHAVLLLLQSNASMLPEQAQKLAENLYASTKGKNTHRVDMFDRKFWFGGTESFVFNKLEEIALSDRPQTPALGCGVTYALSKEYLPAGFGTDYMPSRINWVVQSSGVDYLHLLIVSMDYLLAKYDIKARYLISVHDELRYLVPEEDRYRCALALQIANLWTRSMFAYKLGMDDLPQGVAFFSAVDVDHVLRKEVDMPCVTPSQPNPIAPGESLNITRILEKTNGGTLWKDGRSMSTIGPNARELEGTLEGYTAPNCLAHRAPSVNFLRAQAALDFGEVKNCAEKFHNKKFKGGVGGPMKKRRPGVVDADGKPKPKPKPVDMASIIEQYADRSL